ncbi:hypothetical protein SEA_PEPE25_66 [Microbacterium phage Pepe25]|nr:hypothetical protein SEA_PEPE25_66 [Microbacterium phage Pepe25]
MSVADEAKAAAEAEYPAEDLVLIRNGAGEPMAAIAAGTHVMSRVPFAHGYQRGYEAATVEIQGTRIDGSLKMERLVNGRWVAWDGTVIPGESYTVRTVRARP